MSLAFLIAVALAGPPSQADLDACAAAQVANDFDGWSVYLAEHPDGICTRAPAAADVADCQDARLAGDPNAWGAYAALHPRGFCITEAKGVLHASTDDEGTLRPADTRGTRTAVGGAEKATGPTVAHGALSVDQIGEAFAGFVEPVRGCGEGVARVHAAVLPSGEVVDLEVDGVDEEVAGCVTLALRGRLAFPASPGPTRLVHRLPLDAAE